MKMPEMTGLELIRRIRDKGDDTATIMMTGFGTVESAIEAMKLGSFDYILKPFKTEQILGLVTRALREQQVNRENVALRETVGIYELSDTESIIFSLFSSITVLRSLAIFLAVGLAIFLQCQQHTLSKHFPDLSILSNLSSR